MCSVRAHEARHQSLLVSLEMPGTVTPAQSRRRRLGPTQSSVVSATITRRVAETRAKSALRKAVQWSGPVALLLLVEWYVGLSAWYLEGTWLLLFQCAELGVSSVLLLSVLYDVTLYLSTRLSRSPVRLTTNQKKMLGVTEKTPGYVTVATPVPFGSTITSTPLLSHSHTSPLTFMTPNGSLHSSLHSTPHTGSFNLASCTPTPTSFQGMNQSYYGSSPFSSERMNGDYRGSPNIQSGLYGSQVQSSEYSPSPRKYHIATRSHSPGGEKLKDSSLYWDTEAELLKLGVKKSDLDHWTERCRKWLAQTVVCPLAKEIEGINKKLCKMGNPELQIGSVNLGTLRLVAKSMSEQLPSLTMVIPYLELSTKQEYIVERIKELAKSSSNLSGYRWNSGGTWKGRTWEPDLPNDSQIVAHLLCSYLDSQMPPNPRFTDGRAFSSQYFLKCPEKPDAKKTSVCLYQENINPPHYKVLVKDGVIDIPQGRNNLYHAIVVFLHCIRTKEDSLLGQVNLKTSGINILWIINSS